MSNLIRSEPTGSKAPTPTFRQRFCGPSKAVISRVPQVTVVFWIIKCLATALGETMADQMVSSLNDSKNNALAIFGCILFVLLCV